jgi:RHS repeat-associated protein
MRAAVAADREASLNAVWSALLDVHSWSGVATTTPVTRYVHVDNLGSTNVTSSASGTLAQLFSYAPYGSVLLNQNSATTTAARQYIGQYYDGNLGLLYLNSRYYNGVQGQFTTEDPVFLSTPSQQNIQDPQSLNAYSYSEDNPITREDPWGKYSEIDGGMTDFGFSGQIGIQYTLSPLVVNLTDAGGGGYGFGVMPFSYSAPAGPVPQYQNPITTYGGDAALIIGAENQTNIESYSEGHVNVQNRSTDSQSIVATGFGADAYVREQISIPLIGSPFCVFCTVPTTGLKLASASNFSTPNYVAKSPSIYYSNSPQTTTISAYGSQTSARSNVPIAGGGSGLPATVNQGGTSYYRNSSGLLSTSPGH